MFGQHWSGEQVEARLIAICGQMNGASLVYHRADLIVSEIVVDGRQLLGATAEALGGTDSDLAIHLLRHCWVSGTGHAGGIRALCLVNGWSPSTHYRKVKRASGLVAKWLNARSRLRVTHSPPTP